ncbi:hypothetical protein INR49_007544 [Caranx melampygus]|nr:hypothetical protein INR49_007544 [Caranx melampygus]
MLGHALNVNAISDVRMTYLCMQVINVDDDGNELGSGVMELTDAELVLHTHRRDDTLLDDLMKTSWWLRSSAHMTFCYLLLTGDVIVSTVILVHHMFYQPHLYSPVPVLQSRSAEVKPRPHRVSLVTMFPVSGIFAFKCSRAEEIFNLLQEVMHSHSISVVEEAVMETHTHTPAVPNGVTRIPSVGEAPSHPSSRHPSVASTRLPSVGEESTHPLLVADEAVHTYVNTTGLLEDQPSPLTVTTPLESPTSPQSQCPPTPPPPPRVHAEPPAPPPQPEPQVLLEPQGVRFVLGPTPVQRQLMEKRQQEQKEAEELPETNGHAEAPAEPGPAPPHSNGSSNSSTAPRRHRPPPLTPDLQNVNNSAQRRTALLDYENLPALPPVWEARKPSSEEEENGGGGGLKTPSLNGYNHHPHHPHHLLHHSYSHPLSAALEPSHNYVNTENVTAPLSAHRPDTARRRADGPTIFNFDFRRPPLPGHAEPPKP